MFFYSLLDIADIYQFHNPAFCPKPGDGSGLYETMFQAREQEKICHIGITNHRYWVAEETMECRLYETVQFPFSYLSGGLITDSALAYAYLSGFEHVEPVWGYRGKRNWMSLLLCRAPKEGYLNEEWQEKMEKIAECLYCGKCKGKCPYGLDTPALLEKNYEDYKSFL